MSRCISYKINEGKFPNTEEGRKKAAGECGGIWENASEFYITSELPINTIKAEEGKELQLIPDTVVMGRGNFTYYHPFLGEVYVKEEDLIQSIETWKDSYLVLNHSRDIEDIVGHLEDIHYSDGKLSARPVIDDERPKAEYAKAHIHAMIRNGRIPHVSWAFSFSHTKEDVNGKSMWCAKNIRGLHLGMVDQGQCSPADGCGIGLCNESTADIERIKAKRERLSQLRGEKING